MRCTSYNNTMISAQSYLSCEQDKAERSEGQLDTSADIIYR